MTELAVLLLIAAAGHGLSRWTGLPVIPILLGLGMAVSLAGFVEHPAGLHVQEDPLFFVIEMGLTILVFSSGLELNPQRFRRHWRQALWVGLVQFAVMGGLGIGGACWLGFSVLEAVYLGFAVSVSSTLVVLRHLQQRQQSFEPHGRMMVGVVLIQDALMVLVLVVLAHSARGGAAVAEGCGWVALMAAAAWALQWRGARWLMKRCGGDEELMLLTALATLFVFLGAAHWAGLPLVVGAFLAGGSLSRFPVSGWVNGLLPALLDFFRAIFFVALGALVAPPNMHVVGSSVVLALGVVVLTPPLVALVAEWRGSATRPAIESGLVLAQTSEYSLVLGLLGLRLGHLSPEVFAVITLVAVFTMTATPLLAREAVVRALMHVHPARRRPRSRSSPVLETGGGGHVLILGLGAAGLHVVQPLLRKGLPVLVVDDDPGVIAGLERRGIPALRGDGADEQVLERAGIRRARLVVASMRRVQDSGHALVMAEGAPVLVRVFEEAEAAFVRRHGGIPVSNAEAAADEFMKWFATLPQLRG